jgi:DHA2 family methylenomycin A resistance protein-like MFS transporter
VKLLPQGPTAEGDADVPGQLLGTIALAALVFALIEGGHSGFGTESVVAAVLIALAALGSFVAVELRRRRPLIDVRWFSRPEFTGANAGAGLMNLGTLGALFALSLFLQDERGLSPLQTGLNLVPLAAPLAIFSLFSGRLIARIGPRVPAGLGLLACAVAYLALSTQEAGIEEPLGWALLALGGTGMGIATPALVAGATEALGPDRAGIASAVNNTSRQVGGAIGIALIGGFAAVDTSLLASGLALAAGGATALVLVGRPARSAGSSAKHPVDEGRETHCATSG